MPRFYCPPPLPVTGSMLLPPDAAHHAAKVLRLRKGDAVELFDGQGSACAGVISEIGKRDVWVDQLVVQPTQRESPLRIVLAQVVSSNEKMDWLIQKATELGVSAIQPLFSERSQIKLDGERSEKRLLHWQKVVVSACEQCGRNVLPEVRPLQMLKHWLPQQQTASQKLIMLPTGAVSLQQLQASPDQHCILLIGPEGGFSAAEAQQALDCGFVSVLLGPRILRTETAALAGIVVLQTLWGDFN